MQYIYYSVMPFRWSFSDSVNSIGYRLITTTRSFREKRSPCCPTPQSRMVICGR